MLKELHDTYPGVSCMKSLGRMFVWWPGFYKQVEELVQDCNEYQCSRSVPFCSSIASMGLALMALGKATLELYRSFSWSSLPGSHQCPFQVAEVCPMTSMTSTATVERLRVLFAQFKLPEMLVTDNGTKL